MATVSTGLGLSDSKNLAIANENASAFCIFENDTGRGIICNIAEFTNNLVSVKNEPDSIGYVELFCRLSFADGMAQEKRGKSPGCVLQPTEARSTVFSASFIRWHSSSVFDFSLYEKTAPVYICYHSVPYSFCHFEFGIGFDEPPGSLGKEEIGENLSLLRRFKTLNGI